MAWRGVLSVQVEVRLERGGVRPAEPLKHTPYLQPRGNPKFGFKAPDRTKSVRCGVIPDGLRNKSGSSKSDFFLQRVVSLGESLTDDPFVIGGTMGMETFYRMLSDVPELKCPECGHDTQPVMRAVLEIRREACLSCGAPLRFLEERNYGVKQPSLYRRGLLPGFPQPNVHWSLGGPSRHPLWAIGNADDS